jgi:hypothetical protein
MQDNPEYRVWGVEESHRQQPSYTTALSYMAAINKAIITILYIIYININCCHENQFEVRQKK